MHVIATAGHVDHGKSTLVRALTGTEPDRWAEERRRGMTIDLGFAWTELPGGHTVAFVDVPGHERFVPTMLAGIGPTPAVLFVVAADEGWMPQSREHLDAVAGVGTKHGLLVITRSDLMEPELALAEAQEHLAASALGRLPSVCVSGITGAGLDELRGALAELVGQLPQPDPAADVRLWVDRAFTIRGAGTVVTGTLPSGRLRVGDELLLQPGGRRVMVRGLQSLGEPVTSVTGVARVAVNLRGVARESVGRGDVLVSPGRWLTSTVVDVRLNPVCSAEHTGGPFAGLSPDPPAEPRAERAEGPSAELTAGLALELTLHIGAAAVPVRVRPLGADTARLTLRTALPLRIGDRGLLRDPGQHRIVAGLTVLDVRPPPLARRGAAARRAEALTRLSGTPDPAEEVARRGLVRHDELAAMGADLCPPPDRSASRVTNTASRGRGTARRTDGTTAHLDRAAPRADKIASHAGDRASVSDMAAAADDTAAPAGEAVLRVGDWLLARDRAVELANRLVDAVAEHDAADPLDAGLAIGVARQALALPEPRLVEAVLTISPAADRLVLRDGRVRRVDAAEELPAALRNALNAVRAELVDNPFLAPETGRLAELGLGPKELASLVRAGELARIAPGIYLLPGAEQAAVQALARLDEPRFSVSTARQALSTSRRVAVPLLELLARHGHTSRGPDGLHRLVHRA
jgi:selenocysteine-specific elongation factor